ncbi:MAG: LemA family protein [Roseibacillus sp.]|nr:LemA family protein [Roseibacillus sp.]
METYQIILALLVLLAGACVVWAYNMLVKARNQMREGWSGIEVQLKRRHDLIPSLVQCVKGYQTHERELLETVSRERTEAQAARGAGEAGGAEKILGRDLGKIVALAEAYPDLKADKSFRGLMGDLVEIEDQIQYARRYYNGSVRDLNNAIESFPSNLVAGRFGFEVGDFFEVETASERLPPDLAAALKGG